MSLTVALFNNEQRVHISTYDPSIHRQALTCPVCKGDVAGRKGNKVIHHYYHLNPPETCPTRGRTPTTEWHLSWQALFPPNQVEVYMCRDGQKHFADIVTAQGRVIEIQHSPLTKESIEKREEFYGNMVWIFDLRDADVDFHYRMTNLKFYMMQSSERWWQHARKETYLHLREGFFKVEHIGLEGHFIAREIHLSFFLEQCGLTRGHSFEFDDSPRVEQIQATLDRQEEDGKEVIFLRGYKLSDRREFLREVGFVQNRFYLPSDDKRRWNFYFRPLKRYVKENEKCAKK